jgi:hypothetical protein
LQVPPENRLSSHDFVSPEQFCRREWKHDITMDRLDLETTSARTTKP